MTYLSRRAKSFFFWGLGFCLVLWYEDQPQRIEEQVQKVQLEIDDARERIARGDYVHVKLCRDGWVTPSSGQGTCSWHGGIDTSYSAERSAAFRTANRDINAFRSGRESWVTSQTVMWAVLIFLFAPLLDLIILRRTHLYPDPLRSGPSQLPSEANPPTATSPPLDLPVKRLSDPNGCPVCGSSMVLRVAGRGKNRGKSFFGCSMYPRCRGTRPNPKESA